MRITHSGGRLPVLAAAARHPLARFSAGASLGFLGVVAPISVWLLVTAPELPMGLTGLLPRLAMWTAGLAVGYAAALRGMRHWLRTDALGGGRRSVVAGMAAAGAMIPLIQVLGPVPELLRIGVAAVVGAGLAGAMYFPWLLRSDERRALRALDE